MDESIIDPSEVMSINDKEARAEKILSAADKLGLRSFLAARDIVNGVQRLNFAFVANVSIVCFCVLFVFLLCL
jgi:hypothetical protein